MNASAADRYRARFRRVLAFIDAHLDESLDVERLSSVAAFSKYHFHRQFAELFGISVIKYVQMMRLKRSSYQLAFRTQPVIDIALASGFAGPEAFARAFKRSTGQSPTEFRSDPQWESWHATYQRLDDLRSTHMPMKLRTVQVRIIDFEPTQVATLGYRGDLRRIGDAIRQFIHWRRANALPPRVSATFNVIHHHPLDDEDGECRYDLCAATSREIEPNSAGIVSKTIPGGRCALLTHVGSEAALGQAVHFLYTQWLPHSGEEPRDFPLFFKRVRFFPDVPEHEAVTEIYLPIR